ADYPARLRGSQASGQMRRAALHAEEATLFRGLLSQWDTAGRTAGVVSPFHGLQHSYIGDLVSHSNDLALLPAHAGETLKFSNRDSRGRSAAAIWFALIVWDVLFTSSLLPSKRLN